MKEGIKQIIIQKRKKFDSLRKHNTNLPSPVSNKYVINGDIFQKPSNKSFFNPYNKRFNVRRLNKTQQSRSHSKQINKDYDKLIPQIFQVKPKTNKRINFMPFNNKSPKKSNEKFQDFSHTLDIKKTKNKMPEIQKDYSSLAKKSQKSPYLLKHKLRTMQDQTQNNYKSTVSGNFFSQKKNKYSFMTKFQLEQIQKYEIYFSGQRRISSLKQFTDNQGNAKITIGDSIAYRYEIKNIIGQGSFGQVFKSFDHKKKEFVALKIIRNHPKFNRQAKIQIKILETVLLHDNNSQHNIVKLKHAFIFRGHTCLVFELLHINLYEFLKQNNFKGLCLNMIRRIAIQILQGLMFFRKFNIVHCDLKPQNIILKQENKTGIKIIDVGSGTYQEEQLYTYIQSRFYRAPEIILGIRYSPKIDIWSFGCILIELYTGYPIFPGQNQTQQMQMLIETFGIPPSELIDQGSRSNKFFDKYEPIITPNSKGKIRAPGSKPLTKRFKNCQDPKFVQFLQKCFRWLPEERFNPQDALLDEWILQGIPKQIKQQHIDIVTSEKFLKINT